MRVLSCFILIFTLYIDSTNANTSNKKDIFQDILVYFSNPFNSLKEDVLNLFSGYGKETREPKFTLSSQMNPEYDPMSFADIGDASTYSTPYSAKFQHKPHPYRVIPPPLKVSQLKSKPYSIDHGSQIKPLASIKYPTPNKQKQNSMNPVPVPSYSQDSSLTMRPAPFTKSFDSHDRPTAYSMDSSSEMGPTLHSVDSSSPMRPTSYSMFSSSQMVPTSYSIDSSSQMRPASHYMDSSSQKQPTTNSMESSSKMGPLPYSMDSSLQMGPTSHAMDSRSQTRPTPNSIDSSSQMEPTSSTKDSSSQMEPTSSTKDSISQMGPTSSTVDSSSQMGLTPYTMVSSSQMRPSTSSMEFSSQMGPIIYSMDSSSQMGPTTNTIGPIPYSMDSSSQTGPMSKSTDSSSQMGPVFYSMDSSSNNHVKQMKPETLIMNHNSQKGKQSYSSFSPLEEMGLKASMKDQNSEIRPTSSITQIAPTAPKMFPKPQPNSIYPGLQNDNALTQESTSLQSVLEPLYAESVFQVFQDESPAGAEHADMERDILDKPLSSSPRLMLNQSSVVDHTEPDPVSPQSILPTPIQV